MMTDHTSVFINHIQDRVSQYFGDIEASKVQVRLAEKQVRPSSLLYQFTVGDEVKNHAILVKVPYHREVRANGNEKGPLKPRLYPKTDPSDMPRYEYTALRTIDQHFSKLDEKGLGTIRVLDYLPEHHAIITVLSRDKNLRQLFAKKSRLFSPFSSPELGLAFHNTGVWLCHFHAIPKEEDVQTRQARRKEYIEAVRKITDFLESSLGERSYFQRVASMLEAQALEFLPDVLPLGLGHGDFAMRNVLVGPEARITVIDTYAKWRVPIYEDIGYFLNGLKMTGPQAISQGLMFSAKQLERYEQAFLEGYFGQTHIPYREIRLFEMLVLLDKWATVIQSSQQKRAKFKSFREIKTSLTSRYFKICSERLLNEINQMKHL